MISRKVLQSIGSFSQPLQAAPCKVCVDSRNLQSGDLFFAIPGARTDGHHYLEQAAKGGAVGAVINANFRGPIPQHLPVLRVDDTLSSLQALAREAVRQLNPTVIAVTGSYGKTTTKEFVASFLSLRHKTAATPGSQNSQIGLPMSILNTLRPDTPYLVVEMGMDQAGGIRRLTKIAPPDIALITTIGLAHAENFENFADIAHAKAEVFEHPKTSICLYNADSPHADILDTKAKRDKRTFSMHEKSDAFWSLSIENEMLFITEASAVFQLPCPKFTSPHVYENLLAAIAAARSAGVNWEDIEHSLSSLKLPERRLEPISLGNIHFINDSFNASEVPTRSALTVLSTYTPSRRVAVIGQMLNLGRFSHECHYRVGLHALTSADALYCIGKECETVVNVWKDAGRPVYWTLSLEELTEQLKQDLREGDVVLLKGSRSNHLWKILDAFVGEPVV